MTAMTATSPSKDSRLNIRLRRLDSKNSTTPSTYSQTPTLPPYTSTTSLSEPSNPFLSPSSDTSSINSSTFFLNTTQTFIPTSTLRIEALGKKRCSLPLSPNELEIAILASGNGDGSDAGVIVGAGANGAKYLSIRPDRNSGSCFLVRGDDASQTPIAHTTYFFGPGKNPKIWIASSPSPPSSSPIDCEGENGLWRGNPHQKGPSSPFDDAEPQRTQGDEFEMVSKKLLSRTVGFGSSRWGTFEWRYASKAEKKAYSNPPPNNVLVLEKISHAVLRDGKGKAKGKEERLLVARLVRSEDTRTRGSSSSSAGNGGVLEMCLSAGGSGLEGLKIDDGDDVEREGDDDEKVIDEVTVLVTCMVMLKKEVDRMRAIQIGVIAGAVGAA